MTIDIRARVYCSLGEIVQGSLSDTYVQGNGLVFCRGSVTLAGIYQPTLGQVVDFAYEKNGYLSRVPRRLRVLSSFADPLTRQTTIQLGCRLTMLEDLAPNNARIERIEVGVTAPSAGSAVISYSGSTQIVAKDSGLLPDSMQASIIAQNILTQLGLTAAAGIPLTARFVRDRVELSQGYVKVLADLLISENYIGYLNESEQLIIRSVDADGGAGPVLRADNIISLDSVGSGELPAENIKVDYSYYSIGRSTVDPPEPPPDPPIPPPPEDPPRKRTQWSYEEAVGSPTNTLTNYSYTAGDGSKITGQLKTTHVPYTQSWTYFNANGSTKKRVSRTRTIAHAANSRYFGEALNNGFNEQISSIEYLYATTTESYSYDPETGDQISVRRETVEPEFMAAGRLSLPYVIKLSDGQNTFDLLYTPATTDVTTDLTITTTDRVSYKEPVVIYPGSKDGGVRSQSVLQTVYTGVTKSSRTSYKNYGATQEGQQNAAWNGDNVNTYNGLVEAFNFSLKNLAFDDSEIRTVNDPNAYNEQLPPGADELRNKLIKKEQDDAKEKASRLGEQKRPDSNDKGDISTASTWLLTSGAAAVRTRTFRVPYSRDDYLIPEYSGINYTYRVIQSNGELQALSFGRVQNRMLLGHRNGLSLQVAPELMPPRPFDPLYIDLDGLAGQYRVNGLSWAFDANGMACSIDAMFWGGVGTT